MALRLFLVHHCLRCFSLRFWLHRPMSCREVCNGFRFPIGLREVVDFFEAGQFREEVRIQRHFWGGFQFRGWFRLGFRFQNRLRRRSWICLLSGLCFSGRSHHFLGAIALEGFEFSHRIQGGGITGRLLKVAQLLVFRGFDFVLFVLVHSMAHPVVHSDILT